MRSSEADTGCFYQTQNPYLYSLSTQYLRCSTCTKCLTIAFAYCYASITSV